MRVFIMEEAGYAAARLGLSLSYNIRDLDRMTHVADVLAHRDTGENKFLESICVWIDIEAPRYWWQQFDTYRVGVTKQSESTMHTILRKTLTGDDFEGEIPSGMIENLNRLIGEKDFDAVKKQLPESFIQRRIVCTNYKVLRHVIAQRGNHKLAEWTLFCDTICDQLHYPQWVMERTDEQ